VTVAAGRSVGGRADACPTLEAFAGAHPALFHFVPLGIAHQSTDDHAGALHPRRVDARLARHVATCLHHGQIELALDRLEELECLRPFGGAADTFDKLLLALRHRRSGHRRSGHPPTGETQLPAGIAQLVEEPAGAIALAARPGVGATGNADRTRQTIAQADPPVGIAQTCQHRFYEVLVAALQDRRRAANGQIARRREDHLVMAHHMFPAPGV
jgi:hypothetical protein